MLRYLPLFLFAASAFAEEAPPAFQEPQGPLTLQQAVAAALANAPELALYPWDLRISEARSIQAGLRPNPELSVELEDLRLGVGGASETTTRSIGLGADGPAVGLERTREDGAGALSDAQLTVSLSQTIELGGKRAARLAAAEKDRDVASWDYEVARAEVAGEVAVRFAELLAAQGRRGQEASLVELATRLSTSVHALVDAGSVSPLEARRADAESERAKIRQQERARALEQARLRLAATWGSTRAEFTEALGDVSRTAPLPALDSILALRTNQPALKRWAAELARRESWLAVERSQRTPDLTVRLGYRGAASDSASGRSFAAGSDGLSAYHTSGGGDHWDNRLVLEASIPLPLFHRNQGAIKEAELRISRLSDERQAWEKVSIAALTEHHAAAGASLEKIDGLSARVLPELESTLGLTKEGYERGKFDFLRVLEAQKALIETRAEILDAQIDYHLALAAMEQLTGAAIASAAEHGAENVQGDAAKQTENHHE